MGYILKLSPDESKIRIFTEGGMECIGYITEDSIHFNRPCTINSDYFHYLHRVSAGYPSYADKIKRDGRMVL